MTRRLDIAALRLNTEMTGQVNNVQVRSVSSWPKVAFKELKKHETRIDPEKHEVEYLFVLKPKKNIKDFGAIKIIEESVWALLGDTWRTTFKVAGCTIYVGSRRKEIRDGKGISFGQGRGSFDPTGV